MARAKAFYHGEFHGSENWLHLNQLLLNLPLEL